MSQNLALFNIGPIPEKVESALARCNEHSAKSGLVLTREEVVGLIEQRNETLSEIQRIEFGEGPLVALVAAFHDSPFLSQGNYAEELSELQSSFYHLKEATEESLADEDLIDAMRRYADEKQGTADFCDEQAAEDLIALVNRMGKDENEDFSEEESYRYCKEAVDPEPEENRNELDRIKEGGTHNRPDNEYADSFYEPYNELYRIGWDSNSRIGGSNL